MNELGLPLVPFHGPHDLVDVRQEVHTGHEVGELDDLGLDERHDAVRLLDLAHHALHLVVASRHHQRDGDVLEGVAGLHELVPGQQKLLKASKRGGELAEEGIILPALGPGVGALESTLELSPVLATHRHLEEVPITVRQNLANALRCVGGEGVLND